MSDNNIFTSSWKSEHFWSARDRLEISVENKINENSNDNFVYVDIVTQGLAGKILAFLSSLIGKESSYGRQLKTRHAILVTLTDEQRASLASLLKADESLPIEKLEYQLERQIYHFATRLISSNSSSVEPPPPKIPDPSSPPVEKSSSKDSTDPDGIMSGESSSDDDAFESFSESSSDESNTSFHSLSSSSSSLEESFSDDIDSFSAGGVAFPSPLPVDDPDALIQLQEVKAAFAKIVADEQNLAASRYQTTVPSWMNQAADAFGSMAATASTWTPQFLKNFASTVGEVVHQKVADLSHSIPISVSHDDPLDFAMLERLHAPIKQLEKQITQLAPAFPEGSISHREFKEFKLQVDAMAGTLDVLQTYFEAVDQMDVAFEEVAEQRERLFQGLIDLSPANYLAVAEKMQAFSELKVSSKEGLSSQWQQRVEKKCNYQLSQALSFLEDLARDLEEEMSAELEEAEAQFRYLEIKIAEETKQQKTFEIKDLESLYTTYCRYTAIHKQSLRLVAQLNRISQSELAGPEMIVSLQRDADLVTSTLKKAKLSMPHPHMRLQDSLSLLVQRLQKYANPKEVLLKRLHAYENQLAESANPTNQEELDKQLTRSYTALAFLGRQVEYLEWNDFENATVEKSQEIKIELTKALKELGSEATYRKQQQSLSLTHKQLYEDVYRDGPAITTAKQQVLKTHKLGLSETPAGVAIFRSLFLWLQFWDLVSPMAGLLIQPVGQRDYQFHLRMAAQTAKTDPEQCQYHLKMARGVFGMHPEYEEFVNKFEEYITGDVSYHMEKIATPFNLEGGGFKSIAANLTDASMGATLDSNSNASPSWWDVFLGRDPEQAAWKDKSDWEKWTHYTIYPQVRDHYFDALLNVFENQVIPFPSLDSTPEQQLTYLYSQMYQSLKRTDGSSDYAAYLNQAQKIHHYNDFSREFGNFLWTRRSAFSMPLPEIPLSTVPVGQVITNQIQSAADNLSTLIAQAEKKVGSIDILQKQQHLVEQHRHTAFELAQQAPPEYASDMTNQHWLKAVKKLRNQYVEDQATIRSVVTRTHFAAEIAIDRLKAFIQIPAKKISLDVLAQIFGLQSEQLDPLEALTYHLEFIKARIESIRSLCTQEQAAEFCAEYFENPTFATTLKDTSFLDGLSEKIGHAKSLTHAFKTESLELFSKRLATLLSSLNPEDSLFFYGEDPTIVHEIVKQSNNRFTLRHYNNNPEMQKTHAQHLVGGTQKISPYIETTDVPLTSFKNDTLTLILKNTWTPAAENTFEHFAEKLTDFFAGKKVPVKPLAFAQHSDSPLPATPYQTLEAMFRMPLNDLESQHFAFETKLKAVSDFHQLHSRLYAEDAAHQIIQTATTDLLTQVTVWHQRGVIHDEELNFAVGIIQEVKNSLLIAKDKQANAVQMAASLPSLQDLNATPLVLNTAPSELPYAQIDNLTPEISKPQVVLPYVAPLVFSEITGASFPKQLDTLVDHIRKVNALGDYENAILDIQRFVDQIPILDNSFWDAFKNAKQDPHQTLLQLNELDKEYHWSLIKRSTTDSEHPLKSKVEPEAFFRQIKILKIADKLLKVAPLPLHLPLYLPIFSAIFEGQLPEFQTLSPYWTKELEAIKHDWYATEPKKQWYATEPKKQTYEGKQKWLDWPPNEIFPNLDENQPRGSIFVPLSTHTFSTPSPRNEQEWLETLYDFDKNFNFHPDELRDAVASIKKKSKRIPEKNFKDLYVEAFSADGTFDIARLERIYERTPNSLQLNLSQRNAVYSKSANQNPLSKIFSAARELTGRTFIMNGLQYHPEMSRKAFDDIKITTSKYATDLAIENLYYSREKIPFENYLFDEGKLIPSFGLLHPEQPLVRTRVASENLWQQARLRANKGDKNNPKFIREMLSLSSSLELQAKKAWSFYKRHSLLHDPEHQQFFRTLLLEKGALQAELSKHSVDNQQFVESLAQFFRQQVALYTNLQDIPTAAFLLNLSQEVSFHIEAIRKTYREQMENRRLELLTSGNFLHREEEVLLLKILELQGQSEPDAISLLATHTKNRNLGTTIRDESFKNIGVIENLLKDAEERSQKSNADLVEYSNKQISTQGALKQLQKEGDPLKIQEGELALEASTSMLKAALAEVEELKKTIEELNTLKKSATEISELVLSIIPTLDNMLVGNPLLTQALDSMKISNYFIETLLHGYSTGEGAKDLFKQRYIFKQRLNESQQLTQRTFKGLDQSLRIKQTSELNQKFSAFLKDLQEKPEDLFPAGFSPPFQDVQQEFRRLLQKPDLKSDTVSLLYAQLALSYINTDNLSAEQTEELVHAVIASRLQKLPKDRLTQTAQIELHTILRGKQDTIRELVTQNPNQLLNHVYQRLHPEAPAMEWSGSFPHFSSLEGKLEIDLLRGKLYENGGSVSYLSESIAQHETYKKVFGDTPLKVVTRMKTNINPSQPKQEVFQMIGPGNQNFRLIATGSHLTIQRQFQDRWYQLATPREVSILQETLPTPLLNGFDYWYDQQEILLTETSSGIMRYHVLPAQEDASKTQISEIDATGASTGLIVADPASCALTAILERIENQQKMLVYQESTTGTVKRIELPRLGLTFTITDKAGQKQATCTQLGGYVLSEAQYIEALGNQNYLILEKKTALGDDKKMVLFPSPHAPGGYFTCDVNLKANVKAKKLLPKTEAASFNLAKAYLRAQHYPEAFERLQAYQHKTQKLDKESIDVLMSFSDLPVDNHPRAGAMHLKAQAMLARQKIDFNQDWIEIDNEQLLDDYIHYLNFPGEHQHIKLSRDDENLIIRQCTPLLDFTTSPEQRIVFQRKLALGHHLPDEQVRLLHAATLLSEKTPGKTINFSTLKAKNFFSNKETIDPIINKPFITFYNALRQKDLRADIPTLSKDIETFLDHQFTEPKSKQELIALLDENFKTHLAADSTQKALESLLLKAVMDHPEYFPIDLAVLDHIESHQRKMTWFQKEVASPLKQLTLTESSLNQYVFGVPVDLPLSAPVKSVNPSISFQQSPALKASSPKFDLPVTTVSLLSLKEVPPSPEAIANHEAIKKGLDAFCNQNVKDNIARKELTALQIQNDDYFASDGMLKPTYEIIDQTQFAASIEQLELQSQQIDMQLNPLKEAIETLANKLPADPATQDLFLARMLAEETKPVDLEECIFLFLRRDVQEAHARNPALTPADIHQLHTLTRDYLLLETEKQYLGNLVAIAGEDIQRLGREAKRTRAYDPNLHPEYLTIERASGFRLTGAQIKSLDSLEIVNGTIGKPENLSKLIEFAMGAGKTSMIIPLLSFLLADGVHLPLTILPKALIKSMIKGYEKQLGNAFSKVLKFIEFDRDSPVDADSLSRLEEIFETVIKEKQVLLMSKESVNALFLKMNEVIFNFLEAKKHNPNAVMPTQELSSFQSIFRMLKESGVVAIDEYDTIQDVSQSTHFPLGVPQKHGDLYPVVEQTILDFHRFLYANPSLHQKMKLTRFPSKENIEPFSDAVYQKEIKPGLIQDILLGKLQTKSGKFEKFINNLTQPQRLLIQNFLGGKMTAETLAFTDTLSPLLQDTLAVLSDELNTLLPLMAAKNLFEHYGIEIIDEKGTPGVLAAPRHQDQASPPGTQYEKETQTIDATIRIYQEIGLPSFMIQEEIQRIRQEAEEEMEEGALDFMETVAAKKFISLLGSNQNYQLLSLSEKDREEVTHLINANPESIFYFVEKHVLPKIEVYKTQLDADSQLSGMLFSRVLAMTGTAWNADTYPPIFPLIEPSLKPFKPSFTAINTLYLLKKNTPEKVVVIPTIQNRDAASAQTAIRHILPYSKTPTSLIDAGDIFRGFPGEDIAKYLYEAGEERGWNMKGAGFYTPKDAIMVVTKQNEVWKTMGLAESGISKEELLFYWDPPHNTGSDIKTATTMNAALTASRHTMLRDELQGAWRLRGLNKKQTVYLVIDQDEEKIIRQALESELGRPVPKIGRDELLLYAILVQAKRQGLENYESLTQKFYAILREKVLSVRLYLPIEKMIDLCDANRGLFESSLSKRPYEATAQASEKALKQKVVKADIKKFLESDALKNFLACPELAAFWSFDAIKQEVNAIAKRDFPNLPDEILQANDYGKERFLQVQKQQTSTAEKATETQTQTTKETQTETEKDETRNNPNLNPLEIFPAFREEIWPPQKLLDQNYFANHQNLALPLARVFAQGLEEYADLFDPHILCSANLCPVDVSKNPVDYNDWRATTRYLFSVLGGSTSLVLATQIPWLGPRDLYDIGFVAVSLGLRPLFSKKGSFHIPFRNNLGTAIIENKLAKILDRSNLKLMAVLASSIGAKKYFADVPYLQVPYSPFTTRQEDFSEVLVIENKASGELQMLLLSDKDRKQFKELLITSSHSPQTFGATPAERQFADEHGIDTSTTNRLMLYDLYKGSGEQADSIDRILPERLESNPAFQSLKVQAKFLKGEVRYSLEELKSLESWFKATDCKKLQKLFVEKILPWSVTTSKQYTHSRLAKLFAKLK